VPALGPSSFVPALFLQLLAQRIVLGNTAGHGWLQLVGAATATGSAKVGSVARNGASWGRIKPGDVLVAINSQPVRTMADVGSLLYTSSPGQPTVVSLVHNGHRLDRVVHLAASP
jgi:S1-C subfamily serine protease